MITMKAIRPKRFRNEAYRQYALEMAGETAKEVKADFEETTKTWHHKVVFEALYNVGPNLEILVGTDDKIYGYVNYGTRPHPIFAGIYTGKSKKKALAFPTAFTPKTTPNVIGSGQGSSGGTMAIVPYVQHPGTEPRNFDKIIRKKWESRFKRRAEKLLRDFARASGHYGG